MLAYGVNFNDQFRRAAVFVTKILKALSPATRQQMAPTDEQPSMGSTAAIAVVADNGWALLPAGRDSRS
jgi:hypothetical protein